MKLNKLKNREMKYLELCNSVTSSICKLLNLSLASISTDLNFNIFQSLFKFVLDLIKIFKADMLLQHNNKLVIIKNTSLILCKIPVFLSNLSTKIHVKNVCGNC